MISKISQSLFTQRGTLASRNDLLERDAILTKRARLAENSQQCRQTSLHGDLYIQPVLCFMIVFAHELGISLSGLVHVQITLLENASCLVRNSFGAQET